MFWYVSFTSYCDLAMVAVLLQGRDMRGHLLLLSCQHGRFRVVAQGVEVLLELQVRNVVTLVHFVARPGYVEKSSEGETSRITLGIIGTCFEAKLMLMLLVQKCARRRR